LTGSEDEDFPHSPPAVMHLAKRSLENSNKIARLLLDFSGGTSMGVQRERKPMDRTATKAATKIHLREIHQRLVAAAGIAKAADVCAEAGNIDKGPGGCARH